MSNSLLAMGWRPSVADWGDGMYAYCKPRVQLFTVLGKGWPYSVLWYHQLMSISCHFQDCKALLVLSLTWVRSTMASTGLYLFTWKIAVSPIQLRRLKLLLIKVFINDQPTSEARTERHREKVCRYLSYGVSQLRQFVVDVFERWSISRLQFPAPHCYVIQSIRHVTGWRHTIA